MISWVDVLLHRWGKWAVRSVTKSVGYSSCSPMFRDLPSEPGALYSYDPSFQASDIYDCDNAVSRLDMQSQNILSMLYVMGLSWRTVAKNMDISRTRIRAIVDDAQASIARDLERVERVA